MEKEKNYLDACLQNGDYKNIEIDLISNCGRRRQDRNMEKNLRVETVYTAGVWGSCVHPPLPGVWLPGLRPSLEIVWLVALKENARRNLSEGLLFLGPGAVFKLRLSSLFPA